MPTTPSMVPQPTTSDVYVHATLAFHLSAVLAARKDTMGLERLSSDITQALAPGRFHINRVDKFRVCKSVRAALGLLTRTLPGWGYSVRALEPGKPIRAEVHRPVADPRRPISCGALGATLPLAIVGAVLHAVLDEIAGGLPKLCEDEGCPHHGAPHVCVPRKVGKNAALAMGYGKGGAS